MKIDFAPINVPFSRRMQTFGVLWFTTQFLFLGLLSITVLTLLLFTQLWWITALYCAWMYYDRDAPENGGNRTFMRRFFIFKPFAQYFPIHLIKTAELSPDQNYIIGVHPHGIFSFSHFLNFATEGNDFSLKFPGIKPRLLTLSYQFYMPIHREMLLGTGSSSASHKSFDTILSQSKGGNAAVIVVGGAREVLDTNPNVITLTLKSRRGFIRKALMHGASLVPVISFGENQLYKTLFKEGSLMSRLNQYMLKFVGYPIPLFYGRGIFQYSFGLLPYRKPIVTVVGEPIPVEKCATPTPEDVDALLELYISKVEELFEANKHRDGIEERKLIIK